MYKATVNGKQFEITATGGELVVNGEVIDLNTVQVSDGYFHVILKNKSYRAEVVKVDTVSKTFTFKINGRIYPVMLKNKFDLLLEKMGMSSNAVAKVNNIKAPMPGLIIDLRVKDGDQVNTGDTLIILEAMKMENSIKSPGEAQVKTVKVKKGESVEKGQTLIEFV
jgi:biotin carboxyl carrier protein